jgi:hypothetical protein
MRISVTSMAWMSNSGRDIVLLNEIVGFTHEGEFEQFHAEEAESHGYGIVYDCPD